MVAIFSYILYSIVKIIFNSVQLGLILTLSRLSLIVYILFMVLGCLPGLLFYVIMEAMFR